VNAEQISLTVYGCVRANGECNVGSPSCKAVMQKVMKYGLFM